MKKKLLIIMPILVILIALPLALLLMRKQQDTRSRASTTADIVLSFHPSSASAAPNADVSVDLFMNTNNKPVNALQFKLTFDKDLLELKSVTNGTSFDSILNLQPNNTTGIYQYAGIGTSHQDVSGSSIKIFTLNFHTKSATSSNSVAELGILDLLSSAANETDAIRYTTTVTPGELTITETNACSSENSKPLGCSCTDDTMCESGACDAEKCVAGLPNETCESLPDRPDGCACTENIQCASGICGDDHKCALAPDITNTPTPTKTPTPTPTTGIIPTSTPMPTPTLHPTAPRINMTVTFTGLTDTPIHPQIFASYDVYDSTNAKVLNGSALLNHDQASGTGVFRATVSVGDGVPLDTTKSYLISLKTDNTLSKKSSGIVTFSTSTPPAANASFGMVFGDVNDDNELSILDYNLLIECIQKNICLATGGKKRADFTDDGKVDALDLNLLYTGFASRKGE